MPAKFEWDPRGVGQLLRSREVQRGCIRAAEPEAARIAAGTPYDEDNDDPGHIHTRDTTRVEPADYGDRLGAVIVQEGVGVILQFGNARSRPVRQVTRGR